MSVSRLMQTCTGDERCEIAVVSGKQAQRSTGDKLPTGLRPHASRPRIGAGRRRARQRWPAIGLVYRRHADEGFGATMDPDTMPKVDFTFTSMADLVKAHQEELGA